MLTYQFTKNVDVRILYSGWPYVINIWLQPWSWIHYSAEEYWSLYYYAFRNILMAWVPEVASVTIGMCRLAHSLMVLYNVQFYWSSLYSVQSAVLHYKIFCKLCSTTVQTVFHKLCSTTVQTVFTLQYYSTNCIQVLHSEDGFGIFLWNNDVFVLDCVTSHPRQLQAPENCIHSAVLHFKLYSVNSTVLQYKLYSLRSITSQTVFCKLCSTTVQTVFCKLCSTAVQTVFTPQYYISNCSVNSAVLRYRLYSLRSTTPQTVFCKLQYYSTNCINCAVLQYKLYSLCGTTLPSVFTLQYYTMNSVL